MSSQPVQQTGFQARAKVNDVPIARLIGFEAKEIEGGRAVVTLAAGQQHANPMGTLHGGVLCDIADAAMGMAFASTLAPDETFTTIELKCNFFGTARDGAIECVATPVHMGRSTQIWDAIVRHKQSSRDIAIFRCTQLVLWPRSA